MNYKAELKILPVNKTVVFNSPIEGDDVLVRTGIITEGHSYFHAILHGYSKDYIYMNKKDRINFVRKLRASMVGRIDKESWEEMGGGIIAKVPFQEMLSDVLINFGKFLNDTEQKIKGRATRKTIKILITNDEELEIYKLIISLVPIRKIIDTVLSKAYNKGDDKLIKDNINLIIKEGQKYFSTLEEIKMINKEKREYLQNIFSIFLKVICNEAYKETFKQYVKGLENTKEDIDTYSIDFITERFDRNLYFINENRLPSNNLCTQNTIKNRKSIILICVNKKHYEIVGRLLPGNKIQREFDYDDPLIKKINIYLQNPEKIKYEYPELEEYLSKSPLRKNFSNDNHKLTENSDIEESDNESDLYYDSSNCSETEEDSD
jgi:hypothetical protein